MERVMSDVPQLPAGSRASEHSRPIEPGRTLRQRLMPLAVLVAIGLVVVVVVGIWVVIATRGGGGNAAPGVAQTFAAPRAGTAAKVNLAANAATVGLHPLDLNYANLLQGSFTPGKDRGNALLQHKSDTWFLSEEDADRDHSDAAAWDVGLASGVGLDLSLSLGASSADLNMQGLTLAGLGIDANAGTVRLTLPTAYSGDVKSTIRAAAGSVQLTVPAGAAVRVIIETKAGSRDVSSRFTEKDGGYETPEFASAKTRITIRITADAGRVTVQ
jgi:hypothetical protein